MMGVFPVRRERPTVIRVKHLAERRYLHTPFVRTNRSSCKSPLLPKPLSRSGQGRESGITQNKTRYKEKESGCVFLQVSQDNLLFEDFPKVHREWSGTHPQKNSGGFLGYFFYLYFSSGHSNKQNMNFHFHFLCRCGIIFLRGLTFFFVSFSFELVGCED